MFEFEAFFKAVLEQNAQELRTFFRPDAGVDWPCTNERFTLEEYIRANCEYPGQWDGEIEDMMCTGERIVAAVRVFPRERIASYHAVSFLRLQEDRIASMVEYWSDDSAPPQWRQKMKIGRPIRRERA